MTRQKVFVTRKIFPEALDRISQAADMEVWPEELPPPYEVLVAKAGQVNGFLSMLVDKLDASLMEKAPHLKVISSMAVGTDNIDVAAAIRHNIRIGYTPGVLTETTADLIFALLMAGARRIVEADKYVRDGQWKTWTPMGLLGQDIHHATLGIIGLGRIGLEVARRARGFNMKIIYYSRTRKTPAEEKQLGLEYIDRMPELLAQSDFISLHVPLTKETHHLIGAKEFAVMKPTAIFINASRGAVIDQRALYEALKNHRILSAAIDVTETEPIPPHDPLLSLDNLIITPHIGSASVLTRKKMALMATENLLAGLRGDPLPNCLNP